MIQRINKVNRLCLQKTNKIDNYQWDGESGGGGGIERDTETDRETHTQTHKEEVVYKKDNTL